MIIPRKSEDRGYADHGWLRSHHSFSFADYHDPAHMGWGNLRVINEDFIAPGTGFGTHGHRDMEIVTYVLEGAVAHKDSIVDPRTGAANSGVIRPGDVQRMSAGTGVRHSEFNALQDATTHLLQIWILPQANGSAPGYQQTHVDAASKRGRLARVAAPKAEQAAVNIHADATLYAGLFDGDEHAELALQPGRLGYVQVARGEIEVNGAALRAGDALMLRDEPKVTLQRGRGAEVIVFDLAR